MPSPSPTSEVELDELLSRPTPGVLDTLSRHPGDLLVLGAGGKMGPTLARMARRAFDALGRRDRVIAVSRFGEGGVAETLRAHGVEIIRADLLDRSAVQDLPDAPNLIYMAGQKFGTSAAPELTWAMNAVVPVHVAQRYARSRTVVFSTGNVYPLRPVGSGGPREQDPVGPIGDYAMSCLARERIFQYAASCHATPVLLLRLNYAVELRYGVLHDTARRVLTGSPVPLAMGHVNVIWQGDANARALQALDLASAPASVLNLTGAEIISVRWLALRLGALLGLEPVFHGDEAPDALLSDARRSIELFGPPTVALETLIQWTADWLRAGGRQLGKPTHFESRDGRF